MNDREALKRRFLSAAGFADAERHPLPGDASTRRYERLKIGGRTLMLMDQPPAVESRPCGETETPDQRRTSGYNAMARLAAGRIEAFVAAATYLRAQGLSAPEIFDIDAANGLLISEDLGDDLFAHLIAKGQDETPLYMSAIEALAQAARTVAAAGPADHPGDRRSRMRLAAADLRQSCPEDRRRPVRRMVSALRHGPQPERCGADRMGSPVGAPAPAGRRRRQRLYPSRLPRRKPAVAARNARALPASA